MATNYEGQEGPAVHKHYIPDFNRQLSPHDAELIVKQALLKPGGSEELFLTYAAVLGWRINFRNNRTVQGLSPSYDDAVGRMWSNSLSKLTAERAYAGLVTVSLGLDFVGDGK